MFFKMLKNDLRIRRGLNIILFIFIAAASVLMYVSAAQLYLQVTGPAQTRENCRSSDIAMLFSLPEESRDDDRAAIESCIDDHPGFTSWYRDEGLLLDNCQVDFNNIDENEYESFFRMENFVTTLPAEHDLVFDLKDRPFTVRNGTVAISHKLRDTTGAEPGDTVRFISPSGRTYEFKIGGFYKESSSSYFCRYFISDDDYAAMAAGFPVKTYLYSITAEGDASDEYDAFKNKYTAAESTSAEGKGCIRPASAFILRSDLTDDYITSYIITVFMIVISIFMLLIILMTIRFTMISAMNQEEKEIGMLRASGVDSFGFRWIFAAKYIAFAVIGGIIGLTAGYPVSVCVMQLFAGGMSFSDFAEQTAIGAVSILLTAGIIIFFCMLTMRRFRKISVINAIHGENAGERYGNASALLLHRRSSMPVCLYHALSDILTRFRRYTMLIIAYTLGGVIILIACGLYNSVINPDFLKYQAVYQMDFFPDFNDEMMEEYAEAESAENESFYSVYNKELAENGIAAHVDTVSYSEGKLLTGSTRNCIFYFGKKDLSFIGFSEGVAPVLANEAAMSRYTAKKLGIQPGDEIEISIKEYQEDGLSAVMVRRNIIITGLFDMLEWEYPLIIMGGEYDKGLADDEMYYRFCIDREDKEAEYQKICEHFSGHTMNAQEYIDRYLAPYKFQFGLLRNFAPSAVILVNILLTMLYMGIFISEDRAEIALQRCIGVPDRSIRLAQFLRMLLLSAASVLLSILFTATLGNLLVDTVFGKLGLSGFRFLPAPVLTWVIMPAIVFLSVLLPVLISLRRTDSIDIRSISEE